MYFRCTIDTKSVSEKILEVRAYLSDRPLELDELLKTLGLYEHRGKLPNQLSGEQQQAIGRAIIKNPDILLCDGRPLHWIKTSKVSATVEQIGKYGNTVIMVTHNDAIKNMADRVNKLRDGQIRRIMSMKPRSQQLIWNGKPGENIEKSDICLPRELIGDIGKYLAVFFL